MKNAESREQGEGTYGLKELKELVIHKEDLTDDGLELLVVGGKRWPEEVARRECHVMVAAWDFGCPIFTTEQGQDIVLCVNPRGAQKTFRAHRRDVAQRVSAELFPAYPSMKFHKISRDEAINLLQDLEEERITIVNIPETAW